MRQKILKLFLESSFQTFLKKDFQSKYVSLTELTIVSSEDALINFLRMSKLEKTYLLPPNLKKYFFFEHKFPKFTLPKQVRILKYN